MKYFVVLDFEATCDEENAPSPQEIIEFPSVLVDAESLQIVDEFREYVKPLHHPQLRAFCTELTGIEQHQVENAGSFPEVFKRHQEWLLSHNLSLSESLDEITWAFVSCGDWDLGTMLPVQEGACNTKLNTPTCYTRWINIKVPYGDIMGEKAYGMVGMLKGLNLTLDGRHHSGLDDSRNIAKILIALYKKQAIDKITGKRALSGYPVITLNVSFKGETKDVVLRKRSLKTLLGVCGGTFKTQIKIVSLSSGIRLVSDDDLRSLEDNTEIIAE